MVTEATNDGPQQGLLSDFRIVHFSGADAAAFLQGYVTCDTTKLSPTLASAGAFCDLRGRVVANGWLWGAAEAVSLLVHASCCEPLIGFLTPYLNFSRTKANITSAPVAAAIDATDPPFANPVALPWGRAISGQETADTQTELDTQWMHRALTHREIWVESSVSGNYLPQMLGLVDLGAIDFAKGCYLGQEVVARAEHRGKVKRQLTCARFVAESAPVIGMGLLDMRAAEPVKDIGIIVGVAASDAPADGTRTGLVAFVGKSQPANGEYRLRAADSSPNQLTDSAAADRPKIELDLY